MNNVMEDFLNAELMKGIEGFDPFVENMEDFLDEENFNVEDMCVDNEAEGGEKVQDFLDEETVNLEDMCFDNEAEDGENLEDFFDEENMISDVHVDMDDFDISIETDEHVLQIMDQVESNPEIPVRALQDQLQKKYEVALSIDKVFRAKAAATKIVVGDYTKQYAILRDYILELQATNPETTARVDVYSEPNPSSPTRQFKRIYVCLGALKKGFKAGMRDFLGLDGTFMKGPFPGQVLTAVGVDSNNGIYPLAYAIVEAENTSSWKWFLDCLGEDLDLHENSNFTFISDRQKGLLPAISQKFPCAEHRFCLKHIYENMRKYWKTREYKDHLWKCATATTIPEFERFMREFSFFDMKAHEWLSKIPAKHWARSHFTGRAVSDMLLNNKPGFLLVALLM
ncbi:hypothetical protein L2E82_45409 [Cichorium intybus]|uniref:Uncharacterized protein n=1 Tax=Cichorium intybus TaxID=13427 RepID=A0ACB8ZTG4_CICIN|nr:hypothetical protein L2E82_45409 [Cichorium intybus]